MHADYQPRTSLLSTGKPIPAKSSFTVPLPVPDSTPRNRISVSEFKSYLACPYRYHLRDVRRLKAIDDEARELDGGSFGTLMHKVLGDFGRESSIRHSDRSKTIVEFLFERLDYFAGEIYGTDQRRPALRLQLEQARRRLLAFTAKQVELVRDGWRIAYAENDEEDRLSVSFPVDVNPIDLVGRVDRIDLHESSRTIRIVDYKTADRPEQPDKAHRKNDEWIDLQLPLYRHLWHLAATGLPSDCTVELGYFNIPKAIDDTGLAMAEWDASTLADADEKARQVIRSIRTNVFWPPAYPAPDYSDDLAAICLDNLRSQPILVDDQGVGA